MSCGIVRPASAPSASRNLRHPPSARSQLPSPPNSPRAASTSSPRVDQTMVMRGMALDPNWRSGATERPFTRPRPSSAKPFAPSTFHAPAAAPSTIRGQDSPRLRARPVYPPNNKPPPRDYLPTVPATFTPEMMRARAIRELCSCSSWTASQLKAIGFTTAELASAGFSTPPSFRPLPMEEEQGHNTPGGREAMLMAYCALR